MAVLEQSGLQADCPFRAAGADGAAEQLTSESAAGVDAGEFAEYAGRLTQYLQARSRLRPCLLSTHRRLKMVYCIHWMPAMRHEF